MPDRARDVRPEPAAPRGALHPRLAERWLFRGIFGLVLASAMVAALDVPGEEGDPGQDALWVLLTALASGAAHGYAHVIARRASGEGSAKPSRARAVLAEWPLTAAVLPTVCLLLGAVAEWWTEETAVEVALLFNTVALFVFGVSAARTAGLGWPSSCRAGFMDMLIGLLVIAADALIE
ncbi:hypothetical protein ACGF5T_17760 [Streptomyces sp. NPDC047853]|uniref:hypothetical protein n=1 Tax=unclassified Streptomyces TaxID=2593676 RepID=UPI00345221E5